MMGSGWRFKDDDGIPPDYNIVDAQDKDFPPNLPKKVHCAEKDIKREGEE